MIDPPNYGPWHPWYAWRPIRTDWHGWHWLTTVERRKWRGGGTAGWDYRPPQPLTTQQERQAGAQALRRASIAVQLTEEPTPPDLQEWADWLRARANLEAARGR